MPKLTALYVPSRRKAYFFAGDSYLRYDVATMRVDAGYPRPIAGNWNGVFERDVDAAVLPTSSTGSSARWRCRNDSRLTVERSAQCRSSSATSTGPRPASLLSSPRNSSNSRPCPPGLAGSDAGSRLPGRPDAGVGQPGSSPGASPASSISAAAAGEDLAMPRSACTIGAYGRCCSPSGTQSPTSTAPPLPATAPASSSSSRVLPMPASPVSSTAFGRPPAASSSRRCRTARSSVRPSSRDEQPCGATSVLSDHTRRAIRPVHIVVVVVVGGTVVVVGGTVVVVVGGGGGGGGGGAGVVVLVVVRGRVVVVRGRGR